MWLNEQTMAYAKNYFLGYQQGIWSCTSFALELVFKVHKL